MDPVSFNLTSPWQVESTVTLKADEGETGDKEEAAEKTNEEVWNNVESYVKGIDEKRQDFWEKNRTAIILSVGVALISLLLIILIILVRSTKNYRLRKKMKQAEEEARRREKEIENKTTEEIEMELRQAMEAEGQRPEERPVEKIGKERSEDQGE